MSYNSPPDTGIVQLTREGRNLLARKKLGDIVYKNIGWQMGRGGYLDSNPVKISPLVDTGSEAVGYIEVLTNSLQAGDAVQFNGATFTFPTSFSTGSTIPSTVQNIIQKVTDTMDPKTYKLINLDVDPGNPNRIRVTSLITGAISNSYPLSVVEVTPGTSFTITAMSGGQSLALDDAAYPAPPTLGSFSLPDGFIEQPSLTSVAFAERIPEGPVGLNGYGEMGLWVEVIDSNFSLEIGRKVLYAFSHFPLQSKTDRHLLVERLIVNF